MPVPSGATKAEKFAQRQLRSVILEQSSSDELWEGMCQSGLCEAHAEVKIDLALPSGKEAESSLLDAVEKLASGLRDRAALRAFYKGFGWSDAQEYFSRMGETQVMVVDVDHNDSDDRLAIILLAFQVASANLERREAMPSATATIYLDARTYEHAGALTLWRTLQLATRLTRVLSPLAVQVLPIMSDLPTAFELIAGYLKVEKRGAALNEVSKGTGDMLGELRLQDLRTLRGVITVWILSGLCQKQVEDFAYCQRHLETKFTFIEQAQPAWQSTECPADSELQGSWSFPPTFGDEKGFGVEPSNIRSSEVSYMETLKNYMCFQQLVASGATYVCPALARSNGFLPRSAPGEQMLPISGRPFNVIPGKIYVIKKALEPQRAERAFAHLLSTAKAQYEDTLYQELCIDSCDDFGAERPELSAVVKYGTFMADAIVVCLAARPTLETQSKQRRLALMLVPKPGEDPVMTFQV